MDHFVNQNTLQYNNTNISLVRSNHCYCCQLWQPSLIKDIKQLETIQRRATKFILSNSGCKLSYKERLLN